MLEKYLYHDHLHYFSKFHYLLFFSIFSKTANIPITYLSPLFSLPYFLPKIFNKHLILYYSYSIPISFHSTINPLESDSNLKTSSRQNTLPSIGSSNLSYCPSRQSSINLTAYETVLLLTFFDQQ